MWSVVDVLEASVLWPSVIFSEVNVQMTAYELCQCQVMARPAAVAVTALREALRLGVKALQSAVAALADGTTAIYEMKQLPLVVDNIGKTADRLATLSPPRMVHARFSPTRRFAATRLPTVWVVIVSFQETYDPRPFRITATTFMIDSINS
jgi:hypothetical protein